MSSVDAQGGAVPSGSSGPGGACCLDLLNERDLEGIVGVGVLLQHVNGGWANAGTEVSTETIRIVLGSSEREVSKPWISLYASVVFVTDDASKVDETRRAVCVKFKKLWPRPVRVLGRKLGENIMNSVNWIFSRKGKRFEGDHTIRSVQSNNFKKEKLYEVWHVDESWDGTVCERSGRNRTEVDSATESGSQENSINLCCGCEWNCGAEFKDAIEASVKNLWLKARRILIKINVGKNDKPLRHFGIFVPINEIGWVKEAYYRNLTKPYRRARKKYVKENIYKLEGELLEEKVRNRPILNIWYSWPMRLIFNILTIIFLLLILTRNIARSIFISNLNLASIAFFYYIILFFVRINLLEPFMKKYRSRKAARARRLLKWMDSSSYASKASIKAEIIPEPSTSLADSAEVLSGTEAGSKFTRAEQEYKNFARVLNILKFQPWVISFFAGLWLIFISNASAIWDNTPRWFTEFEYLIYDNQYIWVIPYIIILIATVWIARSINRLEHTFGELPMSKKIRIIAIFPLACGALYRIYFHLLPS